MPASLLYNALMDTISVETEREIERRLANGNYASADELISDALRALDDARAAAQAALERELLKGLEGPLVEMTSEDWVSIEDEAAKRVREG